MGKVELLQLVKSKGELIYKGSVRSPNWEDIKADEFDLEIYKQYCESIKCLCDEGLLDNGRRVGGHSSVKLTLKGRQYLESLTEGDVLLFLLTCDVKYTDDLTFEGVFLVDNDYSMKDIEKQSINYLSDFYNKIDLIQKDLVIVNSNELKELVVTRNIIYTS